MIKTFAGFFFSGIIFFSSGSTISSFDTASGSIVSSDVKISKATVDGFKQPLYSDIVMKHISQDMAKQKVFFSDEKNTIPRIGSKSYLIGDPESGEIFLSHAEKDKLSIGSLTKLMTAVVAVEHFSLDEEVNISKTAAELEGAKIKFLIGEKVALSDLLTATLVRSGNDGAYAIAEHAPLGKDQFIEWMNQKAVMLGMSSSHFSNPMGFDEPGNFSTARDLFILVRYILSTQPYLRDAVARESFEFTSKTGRYHQVDTTNSLFKSFLKIRGMKTGTTEDAGASFIGLAENEKGGDMVAIVLASPDRFQEAKILFWWALSHLK
ncbi:MAG: D-alanyl-D-alanine carboxypeptidase family protein [Candidatus Gracilibacteria bacterium]